MTKANRLITKTAIGNYLRKQANGDVGMYRNGFKEGVTWAQGRLVAAARNQALEEAAQRIESPLHNYATVIRKLKEASK